MSAQRKRYQDFKSVTFRDRQIAYSADAAKAFGDLQAALFFLQLFYWSFNDVAINRGGWFWKSADEIYDETAISQNVQPRLRKFLVEQGLIDAEKRNTVFYNSEGEQIVGKRRVWYYRVNHDRIKKVMDEYYKNGTVLKAKTPRNASQPRRNGRFVK